MGCSRASSSWKLLPAGLPGLLPVSRWPNCCTCTRREADEPGRDSWAPCGGVVAVGGCCAQLMTFLISFMACRLRACS